MCKIKFTCVIYFAIINDKYVSLTDRSKIEEMQIQCKKVTDVPDSSGVMYSTDGLFSSFILKAIKVRYCFDECPVIVLTFYDVFQTISHMWKC